MPYISVKPCLAYFFYGYRVCLLQNSNPLGCYLAEYADCKSRPRKWVPPDYGIWHPQLDSEFPHLIFEQFPQGFNELQMHSLR